MVNFREILVEYFLYVLDRVLSQSHWRGIFDPVAQIFLNSVVIQKGNLYMHWIFLLFAIIFEVSATLSIKQATLGNTYIWSAIIIILYIISFSFVYYATKTIEIGTVYAIWAGIGTALIVILGWLIFKENMNWYKIIGTSSIIFGVVLLKLQATA